MDAPGPVAVLGSLCSLVEASQAMHLGRPDPRDIGATWLDLQADAIERGRRARASAAPGTVIDLPYQWLAADPATRLPDLYGRIGSHWTEEDGRNLERVLARSPPGRRHRYELARYGLTGPEVEAAFGDYPKLVERLTPD